MKKLLALFLSLFAFSAYAACPNFTDNTTLFAAQLNTALANPCITGGSITGVPVSATSLTNSGGYTQSGTSANTLTGTLNAVAINASGGYTQTGTASNTFGGSISLPSVTPLNMGNNGAISYDSNTGAFIFAAGGSSDAVEISANGISLATGSAMYSLNHLLFSQTAPTISSGFGTTPSIVNSNGTASFAVNVGTGGTASSGVITMPAMTVGAVCDVQPAGAPQADSRTQAVITSTTSITITNYTASTAAALAFPSGAVYNVKCSGM